MKFSDVFKKRGIHFIRGVLIERKDTIIVRNGKNESAYIDDRIFVNEKILIKENR